jgi:flagellar protein FlaI
METQVPFPKFIQTLKELGEATVHGAAFLSDANAAWRGLGPDVRKRFLASLGMEDGPGVQLRIGKKPDAPKSLDNVLVTITAPALSGSIDPPPEILAEEPAEPRGIRSLRMPPPSPSESESSPSPLQAPPTPPEPSPSPWAPPIEPEAARFDPPGASQRPEPEPEPAAMPTKPDASAPPEAPAAAPSPPAAAAASEEPKKKGLFARLKGEKKAGGAEPASTWEGTITELPPPSRPGVEVVETYPVQAPYAFVRILHDAATHEHTYEVVEPVLSERETNILNFIENTIIDVIEVGLSAMTKEQAAELLRKHVDEVIYDYSIVLTALSREKILYYILRDFLGFGKLDPIMRDDFIEDVSCDGPGVSIFLYHRKYESLRSTVCYVEAPELDSYVIKMAQRSGKHVSIAEPLLDATLPDGSRLNATLSDEVTARGSTFTIRKFKEDPFTLPDLVRVGTMNEDLLAYWWLAVQNGASAIYAGGTASGKTTSLNAILLFIPPQMKIVSIEDTREINIPHENWIAGVTRAGFGPRDNNGRQAGEIDMFSLLKAALRQRPEYILVGEVRGQEATALFQAMATGHTAYGTMHADSTEAVIHRLESEPISIPRSLLEALDIVSIQIQTRIGDKRVRRTKELVEIVGLDPHTREILTNEVFKWDSASDTFEFSGVSYVLERIQMERNMTESDMREEFDRRKRILRWMVEKNVRTLDEVGRVISTYYRNRDAVMAVVDADEGFEGLKNALDPLAHAPPPAASPSTALVPAGPDELTLDPQAAEEPAHGPQ